jgi:hypothetical protein
MSEDSTVLPQPDWQSYLCKMDDELASVYLDLNLALVAPLVIKPQLTWLWIKLNSPREDGLSSDEEFDALCDFEDDIIHELRLCASCQYVGRITTKGRREFYFYTTWDFDFEKMISQVLEAHPEYSFQCGGKLDDSWAQYFSTLFPAKQGLEQIRQRTTQQ